jgi:hypothetical protein
MSDDRTAQAKREALLAVALPEKYIEQHKFGYARVLSTVLRGRWMVCFPNKESIAVHGTKEDAERILASQLWSFRWAHVELDLNEMLGEEA